MTSFNERLALAVTNRVGTMWCAYAFCAIALVSLPAALATRNVIVIVSWLAQTFFQLVLLPVILVGQNLQTQRNAAGHDAIAEHSGRLHAHLDSVRDLLEQVHANTAPIPVGPPLAPSKES